MQIRAVKNNSNIMAMSTCAHSHFSSKGLFYSPYFNTCTNLIVVIYLQCLYTRG